MGYGFTKEELKAFADGVKELSPDQLEHAAGGSSADFERAVSKVTDAIAYGIGKSLDGACWVGDKAVTAYNFVVGVISSWF